MCAFTFWLPLKKKCPKLRSQDFQQNISCTFSFLCACICASFALFFFHKLELLLTKEVQFWRFTLGTDSAGVTPSTCAHTFESKKQSSEAKNRFILVSCEQQRNYFLPGLFASDELPFHHTNPTAHLPPASESLVFPPQKICSTSVKQDLFCSLPHLCCHVKTAELTFEFTEPRTRTLSTFLDLCVWNVVLFIFVSVLG